FAGANVPERGVDPVSGATVSGDPGGDMACATPYFSTVFSHCDLGDGVDGLWAHPGDGGYAEQLFVRGPEPAIPEPTSLAVFGVALLGYGAARGRRQ
ncbi:MAG TPA: PEP-CTERM sorting domain-containing protein, partial [Rhodopila sp.]